MKATQLLHNLGQSLWLDNITRDLLNSGTLKRYIAGFHPYFGFPEPSRAKWRLELPAMRKLVPDGRGIPTGDEESFGGLNAELGEKSFDDGFGLMEERTTFSVAGATRRVHVDLLEGYRYAHVFAPKDKDYIALEPMTAPTSASRRAAGCRSSPRASDSWQCSESGSIEPNYQFRSSKSETNPNDPNT